MMSEYKMYVILCTDNFVLCKCIFKNIVGNLSVKTNIMFYVFTESKDLFFLPFYFKSLWLELDFLSFHKTVQIGLLLEPYFKVYFQFLLQSI